MALSPCQRAIVAALDKPMTMRALFAELPDSSEKTIRYAVSRLIARGEVGVCGGNNNAPIYVRQDRLKPLPPAPDDLALELSMLCAQNPVGYQIVADWVQQGLRLVRRL